MSEPRLSHQECWELLPWLVNDSLDPAEAMRVADHLEVCAICREEVRACRELAGLLADGTAQRQAESALGDGAGMLSPEGGFARLSARLPAAAPKAGRWRELLRATPRPVRTLVGMQAAALLVLAVFAGQARFGSAGELFDPSAGAADGGGETVTAFHTLSGPVDGDDDPAGPGAGAADRQRLRLVFADDAALTAVRQLLVESGARLVDGPSPFGVYTVELPAAGAAGETPAERLDRLRRHPAVVFAEPAAVPAAAPPAPRAEPGGR